MPGNAASASVASRAIPKSVTIARPSAAEQDVSGLDVAMDDAADVGDAEGTSHVEPDPRRLPRGEPAAASQPGRQVLPVDQRHDEVRPGRRRCRYRGRPRCSGGAARSPRAPRAGIDGRDRDRSRPPAAGVLTATSRSNRDVGRPVDRRHPAATDDRPEPISTTEKVLRWRPGRLGRHGHGATIADTARTGRRAA